MAVTLPSKDGQTQSQHPRSSRWTEGTIQMTASPTFITTADPHLTLCTWAHTPPHTHKITTYTPHYIHPTSQHTHIPHHTYHTYPITHTHTAVQVQAQDTESEAPGSRFWAPASLPVTNDAGHAFSRPELKLIISPFPTHGKDKTQQEGSDSVSQS